MSDKMTRDDLREIELYAADCVEKMPKNDPQHVAALGAVLFAGAVVQAKTSDEAAIRTVISAIRLFRHKWERFQEEAGGNPDSVKVLSPAVKGGC